MTGQEVHDYILKKFKRTDKTTEIYEAITDVVRDMKLQILAEDVKEEAYTASITELGDYRLALPDDFGHIIGKVSLIDTSPLTAYPPLTKISKEKYDQMFPERLLTGTLQNRGVPQYFSIYADQIYLGNVPDKTSYRYQINYTTESGDDITSTTASVLFTPKYRNYLRDGVLADLYEGMGLYEEAQIHRQQYLAGMAKISANDEFNTRSLIVTAYNEV